MFEYEDRTVFLMDYLFFIQMIQIRLCIDETQPCDALGSKTIKTN